MKGFGFVIYGALMDHMDSCPRCVGTETGGSPLSGQGGAGLRRDVRPDSRAAEESA